MTSKARVTPLKKLSLPKLELIGVLTGAWLAHFIKEATDLQGIRCHYWMVLKVELQWLKSSTQKWKEFVSNQVIEVQLSSHKNRRYCPRSENPMDVLTRGMFPLRLVGNATWWNGPQRLRSPTHHWPAKDSTQAATESRGKGSPNSTSYNRRTEVESSPRP